MEEYYRELAEKGRADKRHGNVHVFDIGLNDVEKFPELDGVFQVWLGDNYFQMNGKSMVIN